MTTITTIDPAEADAQQELVSDEATVTVPGGVLDQEYTTISIEVENAPEDEEDLGTITLSVLGECDSDGLCTKNVEDLEVWPLA